MIALAKVLHKRNAGQIKAENCSVDCDTDSSKVLHYMEGSGICIAFVIHHKLSNSSGIITQFFRACSQSEYDSQYVNEAIIMSALSNVRDLRSRQIWHVLRPVFLII